MAGSITIRQATEADRGDLLRLVALDEADMPAEPALLGFFDGELVAALPAHGGPAVADPFHYTSELVALLRTYARQQDSARSGVLGFLWGARFGVAHAS
jgi:hypothetical protein